jgi:hypothetical protein
MRSEKKFKEKISNLAAMIAEGNYEEKPEDDKEMEEAKDKYTEPATNPNKTTPIDVDKFNAKLDTYDQALSSFYNAINSAQELELALVHIIEKMPNLTPGNSITGMRRAIDRMAGEKADASSKSVSKKDPNAMYDKMKLPKGVKPPKDDASSSELPALQESFNRINRK